MDHHCPFTGNCVGFKNHSLFFALLFSFVINELFWIWICYQFGIAKNYGDASTSYWDMFWIYMNVEPFLWASIIWHFGHFSWMSLLFVEHAVQIIYNITSNEVWNHSRYKYMKDPNTVCNFILFFYLFNYLLFFYTILECVL